MIELLTERCERCCTGNCNQGRDCPETTRIRWMELTAAVVGVMGLSMAAICAWLSCTV